MRVCFEIKSIKICSTSIRIYMISIINTYSRTITQRTTTVLPTFLKQAPLLTFNQRHFALMESQTTAHPQPNNKKVTAEEANDYHKYPEPGKFKILPTKPMNNQRDLSLAYSPGVATPCLEIHQNPEKAYEYTNKGNMVAVISNGTAVLGLGNLGALAGKPVMEGKAVLFNKFAGI